MNKPLLEIKELSIGFKMKGEVRKVTDNISFDIKKGEILGIAGESGSGKSITALSILKLLPENAKLLKGSITFEGMDLSKISEKEYQDIRGKEISIIFQESLTALNPVLTIGKQITEMIKLHGINDGTKDESNEERYQSLVFAALEEAGLKEAKSICEMYPHQLSGGMRQRVMIAMAIILRPKLLIADEPTTALDIILHKRILELLKKINKDYGISILFISHDLAAVKYLCERVIIMQEGSIKETGDIKAIFNNQKSEYTKKLIDSILLNDIKPAYGGKFTYRDKSAYGGKSTNGEKSAYGETSTHGETSAYGEKTTYGETSTIHGSEYENVKKDKLLIVESLNVYYNKKRQNMFSKKARLHVVKDVSFNLYQNEILGIVGESGSGKSTIAKAITGLIDEYEGNIIFTDTNGDKKGKRLPQMVFQDPYGSLNPSKKIGWILREPLDLHSKTSKENKKLQVLDMLKSVGLDERYFSHYPVELSGGQKQRVAIALTLMMKQKLIILDEPVSSLDATIQKQVLKLLLDVKERYDLSYIIISHDMSIVKSICDRVCVMKNGKIIETGHTEQIFNKPQHEYTKMLIKAVMEYI